MATLVLSAIGDDRPGLVDVLAATVADHEGNWDRSQLAQLAGTFAGVVVVTVPDEQVDALSRALAELHELLDVRITDASTAEPEDVGTLLELHLVGQDRPGIVREVAGALARRDVSIEELETWTTSAPMSGEQLFEAGALLRLPGHADVGALRAALEDIANELMVDLDVQLPAADGIDAHQHEGG